MAKNITTTAARKPTEQQAMLIKMATRSDGVARFEVKDALGYDQSVNLPVQTMLKKVASRFGFELITEDGLNQDDRKIAIYRFKPYALRAAVKTKAANANVKAMKAAKAKAAALKTAPAPKKSAIVIARKPAKRG